MHISTVSFFPSQHTMNFILGVFASLILLCSSAIAQNDLSFVLAQLPACTVGCKYTLFDFSKLIPFEARMQSETSRTGRVPVNRPPELPLHQYHTTKRPRTLPRRIMQSDRASWYLLLGAHLRLNLETKCNSLIDDSSKGYLRRCPPAITKCRNHT